MDKLFLTVLNMSLTGAFVIAAICLARLPLKKAPKIISYCLWAVAGFRLVFPYSIESIFSLMPIKPQPIPTDIAMQAVPRIDSGIPFMNNAVSNVLPAATPANSVNPLQIWTFIGSWVWIIVVAAMLVYGVVSFIILKRKMQSAAHVEANIYEAINLKSPFVLGIFKPKIYLPVGLPEQEREYILLHEQTHVKRRDHIIKFGAYFVLCLHWFNPLAWIAFLLMGADMEMSCDERVMKDLGSDICDDYSMSLVRIATGRRILGGSPLAFGEGGMKERIKRVLNFKKPSRVIIVAAVALVAVLSVGFALNRLTTHDELPTEPPNIIVKAGDVDIDWLVGMNKWDGMPIEHIADFQTIMSRTTFEELPYVKNGETITIWFEDKNHFPRNSVLTEFVLQENGNNKYNIDGMLYEYFTMTERNQLLGSNYARSLSFEVKPNFDTALSSNRADYLPGNAIKGYRFVCDWEGNECEYVFVIRGDAAFTMQVVPSTTFAPTKWVDFYRDVELPWTSTYDLMLDEFPGVMFSWTSEKVTATDNNGIKDLFTGMPVWNVYLADLNGDGLPELCATISIGSGIIDTRIAVYDYANDKLFDLSDRGYYDYSLSIDDGQLVVTQKRYSENGSEATGNMAIINGELVVFGIDRTLPEAAPQETVPPPEKAPRLEISFIEDGLSEQRIQAIQLTTSWMFIDENGNGSGYEADSPHPLQLQPDDFNDVTLYLDNASAEIEIQFSDKYLPQSVSVQRWNAEYATGSQDINNVINKSEAVEVINGSIIVMENDGNDYIYEVYAKWEQGSSYYTFRVNGR